MDTSTTSPTNALKKSVMRKGGEPYRIVASSSMKMRMGCA
jgi:hypothetical protein